ncbi:hypothetical protein FIBSPDRAFT_858169 [Athelia psychrophila]|uniref:Uncharacterized protein n=1 Tax=Athelia psychrophila TaxID=1759441 RepID=A0A166M3Y1_9AGAM|nr:hypothetical protein FIBSPDRAFT_858169 [Fibularhizoctonia sp. CBS 109695]
MSGSTAKGKEQPAKMLAAFVAKDPNAKYTFDSERGAPVSEICRAEDGTLSKECITVQMQSTKLFAAMQLHGFFCRLPMDPAQTHMECTPIPKA